MKKQLIFGIVFGVMVLGFGLAGFAQAITANGDFQLTYDTIAPSDLGIDSVGMLPDSRLYFLKELDRSIRRLFTFGALNKAQYELDVTNHKAAELIVITSAGHGLDSGQQKNIEKALKNFTKAQERLNARLAKLTNINGNLQIADLTEKVDQKTAQHVAVLEQLAAGVRRMNLQNPDEYLGLAVGIDGGLNNTLKTFTITVTAVNDAPALKQKATDEIVRAEDAIKKAEIAVFGQPVTFTATVSTAPSAGGLVDFLIDSGEGIILNTNGGGFINNDKSIIYAGTGIADDRGAGFLKSAPTGVPFEGPISVVDSTGFSVGQCIRIENEFMLITAIKDNKIDLVHCTITSVGVPIPFVNVTLRAFGSVSVPTDQRDIMTSTSSDGSYKFTGLAPGKYELFIAGQMVKSLPVGTEGTVIGRTLVIYSDNHGEFVWGTHQNAVGTFNDLMIGAAGIAMDIYTPGGVLIPSLIKATGKNTGGDQIYTDPYYIANIPESPYLPASVAGDAYRFWTAIPSYIAIIANAKGHLGDAREALEAGKNGDAYGHARSAEAMASSIRDTIWGDADINKFDAPMPTATMTVPKQSPTTETPRPSPKASASPTAKPTSSPTHTPTPTPKPVCEHAAPPEGCHYAGLDIYPVCGAYLVCPTPTPTPTENPMGSATPTPTETGSAL